MRRILIILLLLVIQPAFASSDFENNLADIMSWVVLIVMPVGGIYLFWQAHIYPEKVAEKNNHPQLKAIKTMCLLSLFVGGLLWPFALIWANYNYPKDQDELAADPSSPETEGDDSSKGHESVETPLDKPTKNN